MIKKKILILFGIFYMLSASRAQAQDVSNFLPAKAHVITAFTPYEILKQDAASTLQSAFVQAGAKHLHDFFLTRQPLDSLASIFLETSINIGLDNTSPWYFASQRMDNGITHYALIIPTFKSADWLKFIQANMPLNAGLNFSLYNNKYFYNMTHDMLITWNKQHVSIQKFVLPNPSDFAPSTVQQRAYMEQYMLPVLFNQSKKVPEIFPATAKKYSQLSLLLQYKDAYLNMGFEIDESTHTVRIHCTQNKTNPFLKLYAQVPKSKFCFFGKGDMAFFKKYPMLEPLKNKTLCINVESKNTFTLALDLSKAELLALIDALYKGQ